MAGIEETKELLKFGFELGSGIEKSLADGKISAADLTNVLPAVLAAPAAFAGAAEVPKELADLDDTELAELKAFAKAEFDLSDDEVEAKVEAGLGLALELYKFVKSV